VYKVPSKDISSERWRKEPFRTAQIYKSLEEAGRLEPGFWGRILEKFGDRDKLSRVEREALKPFLEFIESGDYHSASAIADAVLEDSPAQVGNALETVLRGKLDRRQGTGKESTKDAFRLLDEFEHGKKIADVGGEFSYTYNEGERLIDELASDIWKDLDSSAQAFFEKYIEEESDAVIVTEGGVKRGEKSYIKTAEEAYEEVLEEDPYRAENIVERFELDSEKRRRAQELQKLEEAVEKLEDGEPSELKQEDIELLKQGDIDLHRFDGEKNSFNKEIGNFLTDRYLWRSNPDEARNAGNEDIVERLELSRKGRRGGKPSQDEKESVFQDLIRSNDFYAASKYAETAHIEYEEAVEEEALSLLARGEKKKAFAALDAFDHERTTYELLEEGHTDFYLVKPGPEKLIDKVATEIWTELEGTSRAFFQMYIDDPEKRPRNSSQRETVADVYHPTRDEPRRNLHQEDAFNAYEATLEEEDEEQAEDILKRFGIDIPEY
jgi:hypothetical protein